MKFVVSSLTWGKDLEPGQLSIILGWLQVLVVVLAGGS